MMEIVFLGTTAAVPSTERGHSAIALKYRDEVILWDCGEGAQRQLIHSRVSYMRVSKIFITHFHGDHFLGLPGLLQTMSFAGRETALQIFGPPGIKDLVEKVLDLGEYDASFPLDIKEFSTNFTLSEKRYVIKALPVRHTVPTYGLLFMERRGREFLPEKALTLGLGPGPAYSKLKRGEKVRVGDRWIFPEDVLGDVKKGYKVLYSSDTRPCSSVISNCEDALLIHDSTFDASMEKKAIKTKHSTAFEAARVAVDGNAKELYLTHISPRYTHEETLLEQAQRVFETTAVARDLMRITPRL
jgi:ribonuclease Z